MSSVQSMTATTAEPVVHRISNDVNGDWLLSSGRWMLVPTLHLRIARETVLNAEGVPNSRASFPVTDTCNLTPVINAASS